MSSKTEQACRDFLQRRRTLVLSTLSQDGTVDNGAVPFVWASESELVILVSELAAHTRNLLNLLAQPNSKATVSGLLLADESETEELFARERLSLSLSVAEVARPGEEADRLFTLFSKQFGEVIKVLQTLPDFHLFKLKVEKGRYVHGFGAAYEFSESPCCELSRVKGA